MYHIAGVLITGGNPSHNTAELYVPSSGVSCDLPLLPDYRYFHTVSAGGLICGGYEYDTGNSCIMWSPESGYWHEALTLDARRSGHVSWTPSGGNTGIYLMGGSPGYTDRATLIKNDRSQEQGFPLKYDA